uniref:DNA-directed RNA polymerase n=1 Tax=viral metagenome TaxID=1070528 RepID=A0A6C0LL69_9ZZZZ|tara:strand:- start:1595 stop:5146 length:3552 start_codon:yes stop_codon:yes gene_type:complete
MSSNMDDTNIKFDSIEDPWRFIRLYFGEDHLSKLVRHQVESYNSFVLHDMEKTINMFNPVHICSEQDFDIKKQTYKLELYLTFSNFQIHKPQIHENNGATNLMFPSEARLRNFTYSSNITIDITVKYISRSGENLENVETNYKTLKKIVIGKIPIMVKSALCVLKQLNHIDHNISGECKYDAGGYFIINGSEKIVLGQERAAENKVYCFNISKNSTKWIWNAEIKSIPNDKCISPKQINLTIMSKNNGWGHGIYVQLTRLKNPIPLFIMFRALNVLTDKDICEKILLSIENYESSNLELHFLKASIHDANTIMTQEDAMEYITNNVIYTPINMDKETGRRKKYEFAMDVVNNDLFPHCNTKLQKKYFLGFMANKIIRAFHGMIPADDRDSYENKRIDLTGTLLNNLFRNYFNKLVKDMQKQINREIATGSWRSTYDYYSILNNTNIYKIVKSTTIENGLKRALSTGDFGIKQMSNKVGVAQVLSRLTYASGLSHSRRISTPIDKSGKLIPPRMLHNTSWGFLCPAETPEGQSVGVVKNLSYMTHVTISSNTEPIMKYIDTPDLVRLHEDSTDTSNKFLKDNVKLIVNGSWIGVVKNAHNYYTYLKSLKQNGIINIYTSVVFDVKNMEIRICNDAGRLTRPLFKVKDNKILLTDTILNDVRKKKAKWSDLVTSHKYSESLIEYVDPEEQNHTLIAMNIDKLHKNKQFSYCEIHASTIFGILASCVPFPDHNQSPRNTYQCAMSKQSMGVYVTNFDTRMDKTAYVLNYPTRPLVDTRIMDVIKVNQIPSGTNVIVAIMTHSGFNQEDSILFNKGSIDRGLFQATIYHTEKDEDKKIHGEEEIRCKPDPSKTQKMKFGNYNKINSNGIIPENTLLENRDIIIAKMIPIKENKNDHTKLIKYEDQSKIYKTNEETYVDKVYMGRNGDGYQFAKIKIRAVRKPVIGDKFSSRHGQKGTIGNIIPEADMPFTSSGIKPDIIINPHAIPSRMTIGQLKETLLGKVLLEVGLFGDGTSFGDLHINDIAKHLQEYGYESKGNDILYNGLTGEQLESSIFIGPAFYQRLKHMVADKQHSRSIGPMVNLTRQPAEGRSRDGGLRFGEMERDCMVSHGASAFTKDRIYNASDKFQVFVCNKCGNIAAYNDTLHVHNCRLCNNRTDFAYTRIPYSCKLLFQELQCMNIMPRLITTK